MTAADMSLGGMSYTRKLAFDCRSWRLRFFYILVLLPKIMLPVLDVAAIRISLFLDSLLEPCPHLQRTHISLLYYCPPVCRCSFGTLVHLPLRLLDGRFVYKNTWQRKSIEKTSTQEDIHTCMDVCDGDRKRVGETTIKFKWQPCSSSNSTESGSGSIYPFGFRVATHLLTVCHKIVAPTKRPVKRSNYWRTIKVGELQVVRKLYLVHMNEHIHLINVA